MPLRDCSKLSGKAKQTCISDNISKEHKAGKPHKQAIAIGMSTGRKRKK